MIQLALRASMSRAASNAGVHAFWERKYSDAPPARPLGGVVGGGGGGGGCPPAPGAPGPPRPAPTPWLGSGPYGHPLGPRILLRAAVRGAGGPPGGVAAAGVAGEAH